MGFYCITKQFLASENCVLICGNIKKCQCQCRDTLRDTIRNTLRDTIRNTIRNTLRIIIRNTIRNTLRDIIRNTIRNTLRDTLCLTETLHPAHTFISGESLTMKGIVMLILLSTCYMFFTGSQLINVSMLCTVLGWSHEAFFATLKSTHCCRSDIFLGFQFQKIVFFCHPRLSFNFYTNICFEILQILSFYLKEQSRKRKKTCRLQKGQNCF